MNVLSLQWASGICFGLSAITKRGIGPRLADRPASLTMAAMSQLEIEKKLGMFL